MTLTFKIDIPKNLSSEDRNNFLRLLTLQGQVSNPNIEKVNSCPLICVAYLDSTPVAIGAIKQVYKTPFLKADAKEYQSKYENELGYIFVTNNENNNIRGLGVATLICKLLLKKLKASKVFATTEESSENPMTHILNRIGFKKLGNPYKGGKTGKNISLFVNSLP